MKFTETHEWLRLDGDVVTVGITAHASTQLGDVTFVELKEPGTAFAEGDEIAVIESVKAASEIEAPAAGTVTEVNAKLEESPELVNEDPTGEGWFFKARLDDPSALDGLMDEAAYKAMTE